MSPGELLKCLADETRLSSTLLIYSEGELCVCELTEALDLSQPKVSRHLAQLRACGVLKDRRKDQWIFYSLNSELPAWAMQIIEAASTAERQRLLPLLKNLKQMQCRPNRC